MSKETIVVTGALKDGIGEAITNTLLDSGFNVIGTYESDLKNKLGKIKSSSLQLHEVQHDDRKSLLEFANSIDIEINGLVNAEMFFNMEDITSFDFDLWDKSIAINLTAPNVLIHSLKNKMQKGSSIVTITSSEAFSGSFGASAYVASKAAIHNLTKTHANNLGSNNIRVNAIAPGWIGGVMDTDDVFNMSREITPLGRLGDPQEVANVTKFLLSKDSSFITGSVLTVDGGYSCVDTISKFEFKAEQ